MGENNVYKKLNSIDEFRINKFLSVCLENGRTNIYVNDELFKQCKYLILHIPVANLDSYDKIDSIDEAIEINRKLRPHLQRTKERIGEQTAFWGHCSNLQAWADSGYDTRVLHSNLSFPLLKKLSDVGDLKASRAFKEEIAKRFTSGHYSVMCYLLERGYLDYLTDEELDTVMESVNNMKFWKNLGTYYAQKIKYKKKWQSKITLEKSHGYIHRALKALKNALENNPKDPSIWRHIGMIYISLQDYDMALSCLKKALIYNFENPEIWMGLSKAYIQKEEFEMAKRMMRRMSYFMRKTKFSIDQYYQFFDLKNKLYEKEWDKQND